jgi:UDP-3-O-[3-hydroxymyristoyl] N-acetylglucosamine deacetylase
MMARGAMQGTLASAAAVSGRGLHTGKLAGVRLLPAPAGSGVVFARVDLPGTPSVPATLDQVCDTNRGVDLGPPHARILTVEHLLSAARGCGIDNLRVELDGEELPSGDGSARIFVDAFARAGIVSQDASRQPLVLDRPEIVANGDSFIRAEPSAVFSVAYTVILDETTLPDQRAEFNEDTDDYAATIAASRTWGRADELDALQARGRALGASMENSVAYRHDGFLNELRFPNELARHKILDAIGDLALLGRPLRASVTAHRAGHGLHVDLARQIAARYRLAMGEDRRA